MYFIFHYNIQGSFDRNIFKVFDGKSCEFWSWHLWIPSGTSSITPNGTIDPFKSLKCDSRVYLSTHLNTEYFHNFEQECFVFWVYMLSVCSSRSGVPRPHDHLSAVWPRLHHRVSARAQVHQDRLDHRGIQGQDRHHGGHPEHAGRWGGVLHVHRSDTQMNKTFTAKNVKANNKNYVYSPKGGHKFRQWSTVFIIFFH